MATHATFAALKKSLPHLAAAYAEGRLRHEALRAYATPAEVVASLPKSSTVHPLVRNGIVGALILEHRRGPNTVWQTLLLLAFEPMIVGLYRARTGKGANEDVEQALLLAFLDALGVAAVGRFTALAVRAATVRGFEALRTAERGGAFRVSTVSMDDEALADQPSPAVAEHALEVAEVLTALCKAEDPAALDLILDTFAVHRSLREHVNEVHADVSPKERRAIYEQMRGTRERVLSKLRARAEGRAA